MASNNHPVSDGHSGLSWALRPWLPPAAAVIHSAAGLAPEGRGRPHSCGSCPGTGCHPGPSRARGCHHIIRRSSTRGGRDLPRRRQKLYLLKATAAGRAHYHCHILEARGHRERWGHGPHLSTIRAAKHGSHVSPRWARQCVLRSGGDTRRTCCRWGGSVHDAAGAENERLLIQCLARRVLKRIPLRTCSLTLSGPVAIRATPAASTRPLIQGLTSSRTNARQDRQEF